MSKRLAKRTRTLLIAAISLVAVVGLLVALLFLLPEQEPDEPDTPTVDTSVTLLSKNSSKVDLVSAVVSVDGRSHTVRLTEEELYTVEGYDDLPLDQGLLFEFAETLLTVKTSRLVVEQPDTPTDFGFDTDTTLSVSATYSDGTAFAFELGNPDPSGEGCYLRETGKAAIYLMESTFCETVSYDKTQFLNWSPITAPESDDTADTVAVRDVLLTGTVRPEPIYFEVAEQPKDGEDTLIITGYVLKKPYFHTVDKDTPLLVPTNFSNLTAEGVAKVYPTNADLAAYGLTKPYSACTVNLALKNVKTALNDAGKEVETITYHTVFNYTIKLGKTDEDGRYYGIVYQEGKLIPIVYQFPKSTVEWVDDQYEEIADDMLFFQYIYNVKTFSLTADGKTTAFALTHHLDAEETDDKLTVKAGGKKYDTGSFRKLYAALMGLYRTQASTEAPKGELLLKIAYTQDSRYGDPVSVEIYEHTAGSCLVIHETGERHLINARDVQETLKLYQRFLAGEDLDP